MHIFISVISHHNTSNIFALNALPDLAKLPYVTVVVKDNVNDLSLKDYCSVNQLHYISSVRESGFGANNNEIFNYCCSELGMTSQDGFLLLNPDVSITPSTLSVLKGLVTEREIKFATGELYVNKKLTVQDHSIRRFPKFIDFVRSFLIDESNYAIDFNDLKDGQSVDCCSGALMYFTASHYQRLGGFDERFYLYCEDFDLCRRSKKLGVPLVYLSEVKGAHLRQRRSRKAFSWYFWQHVKSVFLYSFRT